MSMLHMMFSWFFVLFGFLGFFFFFGLVTYFDVSRTNFGLLYIFVYIVQFLNPPLFACTLQLPVLYTY